MIVQVSVADIKSRFSEYISRVAFTNQKIIITKRNRPIAALVHLSVLQKSNNFNEIKGLAQVAGKWNDFEKISDDINQVYNSRQKDKYRNVSL